MVEVFLLADDLGGGGELSIPACAQGQICRSCAASFVTLCIQSEYIIWVMDGQPHTDVDILLAILHADLVIPSSATTPSAQTPGPVERIRAEEALLGRLIPFILGIRQVCGFLVV